MRARDDDSYQEPVNVIPKEESLESVDSLFERSISLLQKRKRDDQGDPGETTEQASESIAPTSSERIHLTELSTPKRPSILGRVCPPSRSALKVSGGFSTLVNNQCYRMTSRFASPNTLICASALSMLSRKDTSPKALSTAATSVDCRLSPSMTDRLLPTSSTLTKTPGTPCGINFVPQTPDFKPFSRLEHSKAQENESPYSCKSAVHLLPDSFESYPTDSSGIPQISLPLYLLSNEDDNWTKPVIDVKSLISKNADTHPLHSL